MEIRIEQTLGWDYKPILAQCSQNGTIDIDVSLTTPLQRYQNLNQSDHLHSQSLAAHN